MPLSYRIDAESGAVEIHFAAQPTVAQMVALLDEILADPGYMPGFDLISIRGAVEAPSPEYIKQITAHMRQRIARGLTPYRWASVVSTPVQYGMSRMAQSWLDPHVEVGIFRTLEEARTWLSAGRLERSGPARNH